MSKTPDQFDGMRAAPMTVERLKNIQKRHALDQKLVPHLQGHVFAAAHEDRGDLLAEIGRLNAAKLNQQIGRAHV